MWFSWFITFFSVGKPPPFHHPPAGYEYPFEQFAAWDAELDVTSIFERVRNFESMLQELTQYPAEIRAALDELAGLPQFELLKLIHTCFDHPDYGWPVTLYRSLKLLGATYFGIPIEKFNNDAGEGSNGKSFLVAVAEVLFGELACQVKEALLTQKPPGPESPSPALLDLRGRRCLMTPEVEGQLCVQSSWLKRLCDQGVLWHARELYAKREISFKLACVFFVCTNTKLQFTTLDGGIARRAINVTYPFVFKENPSATDPKEKQMDDSIKDPTFLSQRVAGLLYLILKAVPVFFGKGGRRLGLMPKSIRESTDALLTAEFADAVESFVQGRTLPTVNASEMMSKNEFVKALTSSEELKEVKISQRQLTESVNQVVAFLGYQGRRDRVKRISTGAFLKFGTPGGGADPAV